MKKLIFYTVSITFFAISGLSILAFTPEKKINTEAVVFPVANPVVVENKTVSTNNDSIDIADNGNVREEGYRPTKELAARALYGTASFYHNKFNGRQTANGEIFSQQKFTGASNYLPLNEWVRVTNLDNGKTVVVKITDRMHPRMTRVIDLSKVAARQLSYVGEGLTRVKIEPLGKSKPTA